jgi:hypothetical protein
LRGKGTIPTTSNLLAVVEECFIIRILHSSIDEGVIVSVSAVGRRGERVPWQKGVDRVGRGRGGVVSSFERGNTRSIYWGI